MAFMYTKSRKEGGGYYSLCFVALITNQPTSAKARGR